MVWPRFRSRAGEGPFWRTYYVYEHCTDARLHVTTLWLDPDDGRVHRCAPPDRAGAHPVRFHSGDQRAHTGGPPIALGLENPESGQELGLYVVNLRPLGRRQSDVKVGLDFGTSHTIAAVQADGREHPVELAPELHADTDALTLHVSENWSHVTDPIEDGGLKALGAWLPTYTDNPARKEREGLLPSELLTIEPLASLEGKDPLGWQPGRDCVIPFMDMQRRDLPDHLLADFKVGIFGGVPRTRARAAGDLLGDGGGTRDGRRRRAAPARAACAGRLHVHVSAPGLAPAGARLRTHAAAGDDQRHQQPGKHVRARARHRNLQRVEGGQGRDAQVRRGLPGR